MKIAVPGPVRGPGGPTSFRSRITEELTRRGIDVRSTLDEGPYDAILVVAGTRHMGALVAARRRGTRVVHRLDGLLWRHRLMSPLSPTRWKHHLRNLHIRMTRDRLADHVVYQSDFVRSWWHRWYGASGRSESVIHNPIDLGEYAPEVARGPRGRGGVMVCVEGNVQADAPTVLTLLDVHRRLFQSGAIVETRVLGGWEGRGLDEVAREPGLSLLGSRPREEVREHLAAASLFLNLEIHPACPNAVIEALACGVPVIGFRTGSLQELAGDGGVTVPYEGDAWRMEPPGNTGELADAATAVLDDWSTISGAARRRAEEAFPLRAVADRYLACLAPGVTP